MPIYEIEAPDGRVFEIEGDSSPNEQELEEIYSSLPQSQAPSVPETQTTQEMVSNPSLPAVPQTPMTWKQSAVQGVKNLPSSTARMFADIGRAVISPVETLKSIGKLGVGLATKGAKAINPNTDYLPELTATEKYPEALKDFYKQRYVGSENIKKTLAEDPAGLISDLATALTLGGGAISKVGQAGKIGQAGRVIAKVGKAIEPINAVGKIVGGVGTGAGKLLKTGLGMTTGAGTEAVNQALKAGKTGNNAFVRSMRGIDNIQNVVDEAKDALNTIKQQKNANYAMQIGKTINDPKVLDVMPLQKKMLEIIDDQYYKSISKSGNATMNKLDEMVNVYNDFLQDPELRTAGGFDALKQRIQDIDIPLENKKAERLRTSMANTIKKSIEEQSPQYAKTMKDYSEASDLVNELEKSLSLGNKSTMDSAIRKLQSLTRNNANTNYGYRLSLADELQKAGADIMPSLAGQSLSSLTPRGLQGVTATGAGVAGLTSNPLTLATLPAFSPRVVGEGAYLTGQLQSILDAIPLTNANRGLFQAGRYNRYTEE